ncbi:hypothetical protein PTKIN_Ptkin10aG0007700 [Pterospermum kingtungense]
MLLSSSLVNQSFGCMIAVDEPSFRVIAYSENAREMLGIMPQSVPNLERNEVLTIGTDVRTHFSATLRQPHLGIQFVGWLSLVSLKGIFYSASGRTQQKRSNRVV